MIEIRKKNVIIPLAIWNELKKDAYLKEIIEILEDSELLEKTKKESKGFVDFHDYMREREEMEQNTSMLKQKKIKMNKVSV
ncbi:MAG: hypothetical protein M3R36_06235 [Bacteroidota bacterium]|nr:hypothetical protein [Bacteroidota bacterium]